jgi:galactose mutarotase-like enzyme
MSEPLRPWVSIASTEISAQINPDGAQLSRLANGSGQELLWDGDPTVWSGRAPLLFPIVGVLAGGTYRLGSASYRLSRHGFARDKTFEVVDSDSAHAVFRLRADAGTLQIYPFNFELEVSFQVAGPTLTICSKIYNREDSNLFASIGYHPALRWPLPFGGTRTAHFVEFESDESAPVRRIDAGGLLTPTLHPTPVVARRLALSDALFADDVVIFDRLQSRSVRYGSDSGSCLRVDFPDAPYLGIWTKPGAQFICIEPWHGVTDPVGFTGDFPNKPGVFAVHPRGHFSTTMAITLGDEH